MIEKMDVNFNRLPERLLKVNENENNYEEMKRLLEKLVAKEEPILVVATGGSKVVAYYLEYILKRLDSNIICKVIEPRDYFYEVNRGYKKLVAISASGNTNGIKEILTLFPGDKYLISEKEKEGYETISWKKSLPEKENSFISLLTSLAPITLMLDSVVDDSIEEINDQLRELINHSKRRLEQESFADKSLFQIISGIDTKPSAGVLESNLVESGIGIPVVHDKGSFCHGRSNLLYQYPNSQVIYLTHENSELDTLLLELLTSEYQNVSAFSPMTTNPYWQEYELILQMYYLSQKIAEDKDMDLTKPNYNHKLVKTLYKYRGNL